MIDTSVAHTYYPRMVARLVVPLIGSPRERALQQNTEATVTYDVIPYRAVLTKNNHNAADELSISVDWRDAGVDPRLMSNAKIEFFLGNDEDGLGKWEPSQDERRFVGLATDIEREASDGGQTVTIKALDYTTLFIESKPYPPEGVPTYSMNLEEAWHMICDHAGGKDAYGNWFKSAECLSDQLYSEGVKDWPPKLSGAVARRFDNVPIATKPGMDAWAVWQHCVGMLGLISWIDQDAVWVSTATNLYTRQSAPRFIWGKNIKSFRERRNCAFVGKKVCLMSFDPMTGKTIQALWPKPDPRKLPKKTKVQKNIATVKPGRGSNEKEKQGHSKTDVKGGLQDEYDVFEHNGITDPAALLKRAKRVYQERSRQEMQGSLTTAEIFVDGMTNEQHNMLRIGAGEDIRVEIDQELINGMLGVKVGNERVAWLLDHGYDPNLAAILGRDRSGLAEVSPQFYTEHVTTTLEVDSSGGGSYEVEIGFVNKINVDGKDQEEADSE